MHLSIIFVGNSTLEQEASALLCFHSGYNEAYQLTTASLSRCCIFPYHYYRASYLAILKFENVVTFGIVHRNIHLKRRISAPRCIENAC